MKFEEFWDAVEGHYRQQQASYLFKKEFARQYELYGPDLLECKITYGASILKLQLEQSASLPKCEHKGVSNHVT